MMPSDIYHQLVWSFFWFLFANQWNSSVFRLRFFFAPSECDNVILVCLFIYFWLIEFFRSFLLFFIIRWVAPVGILLIEWIQSRMSTIFRFFQRCDQVVDEMQWQISANNWPKVKRLSLKSRHGVNDVSFLFSQCCNNRCWNG